MVVRTLSRTVRLSYKDSKESEIICYVYIISCLIQASTSHDTINLINDFQVIVPNRQRSLDNDFFKIMTCIGLSLSV